ncbi:MAG: DnaB-like helicase C-terminal domain-containing protein, partial [Anaerovibrio sp.]|nr:DnaB-like helicase C-terminal domain-containing protein [Anaerovibrio sp.]
QDADIVMFLYREDYYDPETAEKNITEVIIAKHRNGPVDTVKLYFQKEFTRFNNFTPRQ